MKYLFHSPMAALATMLAMTTILTTASCDEDDDNAVGQPVLLVSDLASSAHYGDSIFLSVACSDAEGVGLSTLKAYLDTVVSRFRRRPSVRVPMAPTA